MNPEEYRALLTELSTEGLDPSRQVEIHTQLSTGINSLFEERDTLSTKLADADVSLNKHRDAMALMYSQLHAEKIKGSVEEESKEDYFNQVTVNDLLGSKKKH